MSVIAFMNLCILLGHTKTVHISSVFTQVLHSQPHVYGCFPGMHGVAGFLLVSSSIRPYTSD